MEEATWGRTDPSQSFLDFLRLTGAPGVRAVGGLPGARPGRQGFWQARRSRL